MSLAPTENNNLDSTYELKDDLLGHIQRLSIKVKELEERLSRSIELSPEDFIFLTELSSEMKSQDSCGTASPQFFTVQTTEMKGAYDLNFTDDYGYVFPDEDYRVIMADEIDKMNEFILDYDGEEHADFELEAMKVNSPEEFEEFLDKHDISYDKSGFKEEINYENAFLTSKACREYIENDRHNLNNDPRCYCMYAQKNPELLGLIKILKKYFALNVNEDYEYMKREVDGRLHFLLSDKKDDATWKDTYDSINQSFMESLKSFGKRNKGRFVFTYKADKGQIELIIEGEKIYAILCPVIPMDSVSIILENSKDFTPLIDRVNY